MTPERRQDNRDWPEWLHMAWNGNRDVEGTLQLSFEDNELDIVTLEGKQRVKLGDYIIRGVKGEIYPCKPDIFEMTYESVSPTEGY